MTDASTLEPLRTAVGEALNFAKEWEEPYRAEIFKTALAVLWANPSHPLVMNSNGAAAQVPAVVPDESSSRALTELARELNADPENLRRVVHFGDEGQVELLFRVNGKSTRDEQTLYAAVYCFIKEKAFRELQVAVEELRELCKARGCYDSPNFTANFRRDDRVNEIKGTGQQKRYMATKSGMAEARQALLDILAGQ